MDIRPVRHDREALAMYRALFFTCFSRQPKFEEPVLEWLYNRNPDGPVVGFDAFDGKHLAAHYVCIPALLRVDGQVERALLSLNTATHPNYQGKGLFTTLATKTYEAAAEQGFASVYGVANANSTPGFVRKLGFQLVHPLDAMIGLGRIGLDFDACARGTRFERVWTSQSLQWRCANPANPLRTRKAGRAVLFRGRGPAPGVAAHAELAVEMPDQVARAHAPGLASLYLGLVPEGTATFRGYVNIPDRLRPSPLNLIFRDLTGRQRTLQGDSVFFSFLDFDAY